MTFPRRHVHRFIWARTVTLRSFTGSVWCCAVDGCNRRRYVADPVTQQAKPRPVASAGASTTR